MAFYATYWEFTLQHKLLFFCLFPLAIALPFSYCLFCELYFSDEVYPKKKSFIYLLSAYLIALCCFLLPFINGVDILTKVGYALSFLALLYASFIAYKSYARDLIERRRKARLSLIFFNSLIGVLMLASFSTMHPLHLPDYLLSIALIGQVVFLFLIFELQLNFVSPELKTEKTVVQTEDTTASKLAAIVKKIESLIHQDKIYRQEGLTIAQLSQELGEKEYLVRKAINQEAAYANFNQFLNHYKIEEAITIIENSPERSMKEIAYHLGYSSPSAFNRAFKNKLQMTPSEFKNRQKS